MCLQSKHPIRHLLLFSHLLATHDLYDPDLLSGLQVATLFLLPHENYFCILIRPLKFIIDQGGCETEECDGNDNQHPPSSNKRRLQVQTNASIGHRLHSTWLVANLKIHATTLRFKNSSAACKENCLCTRRRNFRRRTQSAPKICRPWV